MLREMILAVRNTENPGEVELVGAVLGESTDGGATWELDDAELRRNPLPPHDGWAVVWDSDSDPEGVYAAHLVPAPENPLRLRRAPAVAVRVVSMTA